MTSTYSARSRLEKQGTGDNSNTWGTRLNTVIDLLDEAMDGYLAVDVAGASNVTLTALNGSSDQSRQRVLKLTGALTGDIDVICPAQEKHYIVWNATSGAFDITFKPSGGTGLVIPQDYLASVFTEGSVMYKAGLFVKDDGSYAAGISASLRIHRVAAGALPTDVANVEQVQQGGLLTATIGGSANALTATQTPPLESWPVGTTIRAQIASTNTGPATLNSDTEGDIAIERTPGVPIQPGDLQAGAVVEFYRDDTTPSWLLLNWHLTQTVLNKAPTPAVKGLVQSLDTDAEHDINITAGWAWDDTYADRMVLASEITKKIDAAWAVGNDQGGLDTGSVANATWYTVWLIKRSDTGVVDVLFSASASSPSMPADYDLKRRIGWALTDGSANLIRARQRAGRRWEWDVPVNDFESTSNSTAALQALTVPPDTYPVFGVRSQADTTIRRILFTSPDQTDTAPTSSLFSLQAPINTHGDVVFSGVYKVNSSSQIRHRSTGGGNTITIITFGWIDPIEG